jgi:type II secretion system protein G
MPLKQRTAKRTCLAIFLTLACGGRSFARSQPVQDDLTALHSAVEMYRRTTGEFPSIADGLNSLVERPLNMEAGKEWRKMMDRLPHDPWGRNYVYVLNDQIPPQFGVYSEGEDGLSASFGNDPDDFNTWSPRNHDDRANKPYFSLKVAASMGGGALIGFCFGAITMRKRYRSIQSSNAPQR